MNKASKSYANIPKGTVSTNSDTVNLKKDNRSLEVITDFEKEQKTERLRQEREAFDQQKLHDARWFRLRLVMGYCAIGLLFVVAVVSSYILMTSSEFSLKVVVGAGTALFLNVLGLIVSVFRIALKPDFLGKLSPITDVKNQRTEQPKSDA